MEQRDKNGHTKEERDAIHALFDEFVELWTNGVDKG